MIDLHTHTTESDGTSTPQELIATAKAAGLAALAITDHDTFSGHDIAVSHAAEAGVELICGIELSTKMTVPGRTKGKTVHLLGYFPTTAPSVEFREWLLELKASRHDRNIRLAARLQSLNINITIEDVQAEGRSMAGRPHFAKLMVQRGYVANTQEAFDKYLDETASAYVDRDEPALAEGIRRIKEAGGVSSLAHPIRLGRRTPQQEEDMIRQMAKMGLSALEAIHSDHSTFDTERYHFLARRYDLGVTGGTDFHGDNKPGIFLGTGRNGNVKVPRNVLDNLRSLAPKSQTS